MNIRCKQCGKILESGTTMCPVCHNKNSANSRPSNQKDSAPINGKRCSKCGKMLDSNSSSCPICYFSATYQSKQPSNIQQSSGTKIVCKGCGKRIDPNLKRCTMCGKSVQREEKQSSSIPEIKRNSYGQDITNNDKYEHDNRSQQDTLTYKSSNIKRNVFVALSAIAAVVVVVFGIKIFYNKNISNKPKTISNELIDVEVHETVNDKLTEVFTKNDFETIDISERKQQIESILDELSEQNYISDSHYNEDSFLFEFNYNDGSEGGILIEPFSNEVTGVEKNYAKIDSSGKVTKVNNKVNFDTEQYSYNKTVKAKIMYGLGFDDVLKEMKTRNDVWESEGIDVEIDEFCTVEDFYNGLEGFDYIEIDEHGSMYQSTPVICLEETATKENLQLYAQDLRKNNIVEVKVVGKDPNERYFWIKPSFFSEHYKSRELSGSIVFISSCHSYENDKLVNSVKNAGAECVIGYTDTVYVGYDYNIQDAFVYSLMCGDTVSTALDYAKEIWGDTDIEWYETYRNKSDKKDSTAVPKILGNSDAVLVQIEDKKSNNDNSYDENNSSLKVPELVEEIVSWTDEEYYQTWIDAFGMFYSYKDKYGYEQNEMWFQDVTGDGEPELIVGGFGINLYQPEINCFFVYDKNGLIADGESLNTLWTSRSNYGHEAFTLQAYKDSNGNLIFADGQLYEYTGYDNPNGSGAYELCEHRFSDSVKTSQVLYFTYDNIDKNGEFNSFMINAKSSDKKAVIEKYNKYFADKIPLQATVKIISLNDYEKMTQDERRSVLTESYYAFKYTEDSAITSPLKDMIEKMAQSTDSNSKADKSDEGKDIYSAYSEKLKELYNTNSNGAYYFYDIDSDGNSELIYRADVNQYPYELSVFTFNNGKVEEIDGIPGLLGVRADLYYSSTYNCLVIVSIGGASVDEYPSGSVVYLLKVTKKGSSIKEESILEMDAGVFWNNDFGIQNIDWIDISRNDVDSIKKDAA